MAHPSNDASLEFREMLVIIAKRIDEYTLENLKFQCRDVIRPGRLERITAAFDLFNVLEEMDELSYDNIDFLLRVLKNVDRMDLAKLLSKYQERFMDLSNVTKTNFEPKAEAYKTTHHSEQTQPSNLTVPFDTSGTVQQGTGLDLHHTDVSVHMPNPQITTAVEFVVSKLSRGWQSAARHLGVPDVIIDNAEENWPRNIRRQIGDTFRFWARNDPSPSSQKLIDAMRRVGRNDIADELQYGGG